MRIAVVDDRQEERERLCAMLEQYCVSRNVIPEITCFSSGEAVLESFQPGKFQCMFLDIYMDGIDGMDTAREVYKHDPACRLIFSTTSIAHAVASYEVRAAWYLTKPISPKRLADAMDAACVNAIRNSRALAVHVDGEELNIRFGEIYSLDCMNRQARLHLKEQSLNVDESVTDLMGRLSTDERFLLCNRNTIVNMEHIEIVEDHDFRMDNGICVPIRQRGRAAMKKTFMVWSLSELRQEERV